MDLAQGIEMEKDKENHVSPINFDENYLMFGGDKYKKVRIIPYQQIQDKKEKGPIVNKVNSFEEIFMNF